MRRYAIVLSGGTGTRLQSDCPKQYLKVEGRMILSYVLETVRNIPKLMGIVVVATEEWEKTIQTEWERIRQEKSSADKLNREDLPLTFAAPGANRQLSVYNGLIRLREEGAEEEDVVLIQDAARPNTTLELIFSCFEKMRDGNIDGVIPTLPMKDTCYISEDGSSISSTIDRKSIYAGQAPEAFRFGKYLRANEMLITDRTDMSSLANSILMINGSTEPAVLAGMHMAMIPGDENNYKITTPNDLARFEEERKKINESTGTLWNQ